MQFVWLWVTLFFGCLQTQHAHVLPQDNNMVDLGGYVIILVETKDKKIKLYGELFCLAVDGAYLFLSFLLDNLIRCHYQILLKDCYDFYDGVMHF